MATISRQFQALRAAAEYFKLLILPSAFPPPPLYQQTGLPEAWLAGALRCYVCSCAGCACYFRLARSQQRSQGSPSGSALSRCYFNACCRLHTGFAETLRISTFICVCVCMVLYNRGKRIALSLAQNDHSEGPPGSCCSLRNRMLARANPNGGRLRRRRALVKIAGRLVCLLGDGGSHGAFVR